MVGLLCGDPAGDQPTYGTDGGDGAVKIGAVCAFALLVGGTVGLLVMASPRGSRFEHCRANTVNAFRHLPLPPYLLLLCTARTARSEANGLQR